MTSKVCFGEWYWELEESSWGCLSRYELRVEILPLCQQKEIQMMLCVAEQDGSFLTA